MNINEQLNQGQKEYGANSQTNFFRFEKGDNRIRILTAGEVVATHFFGKGVKASTCYGQDKGCPFHGDKATKGSDGKEKKPSIKYTCYVVRVKPDANGEYSIYDNVQLADIPYSIIKQVGDYQDNADYTFNSFPMPYDITVKFNPDASAPIDMYKVLPSPKRTDLPQSVGDDLQSCMANLTPQEAVQKKKDYQIGDHKKQGIWVSPEQKVENAKTWREKANAENTIKAEPAVEYPTEDIKPEDIPW